MENGASRTITLYSIHSPIRLNHLFLSSGWIKTKVGNLMRTEEDTSTYGDGQSQRAVYSVIIFGSTLLPAGYSLLCGLARLPASSKVDGCRSQYWKPSTTVANPSLEADH